MSLDILTARAMFGNDSGLPNNLRFRDETDTYDLTIERDILPNFGKPTILMLDPYKNAKQWLDNAIDVQLTLLFA